MTDQPNTPLRVESNDAGLAELVKAWLIESRMPLPPEVQLSLTVTDQVPKPDDPRPSFFQAGVEVRAGEPLDWVHLQWQLAPAMARIEAGGPIARIYLTREAFADPELFVRTFLMLVVIFVGRRAGRFHLHAGTA